MARDAVVARERVAPGGRKSRGRVALGEVDSPKGEGRVAPATCARRVRLAHASCPRVGRLARVCGRVGFKEGASRAVLCASRFVLCASRAQFVRDSLHFMCDSLRFVRDSLHFMRDSLRFVSDSLVKGASRALNQRVLQTSAR